MQKITTTRLFSEQVELKIMSRKVDMQGVITG